ncbi:hypothetical protein N431DRAFT_446618 [Stipitochalara longipes BDJ]|nr:hypothetical protein N431DRAFT_446618 [Stipitochalara longipes BDJ]
MPTGCYGNPTRMNRAGEIPRGVIELRQALVDEDRREASTIMAVRLDQRPGDHQPGGPTYGKHCLPEIWCWSETPLWRTRKLEHMWEGPQIVVGVNMSKTTAKGKKLHGAKVKICHVHDLWVYIQRDNLITGMVKAILSYGHPGLGGKSIDVRMLTLASWASGHSS